MARSVVVAIEKVPEMVDSSGVVPAKLGGSAWLACTYYCGWGSGSSEVVLALVLALVLESPSMAACHGRLPSSTRSVVCLLRSHPTRGHSPARSRPS